ncbi:hypothetical protein C7414_10825 [Cupriavidus alkaliphilus]|uniref:hypothetical protein n=1 Tax=Cupriavidus alkaliphilus TaxID=942866 RepID=UPI000DE611E9|nr:hypothetical protein [Cupriavidus alkaliphilus]PVY77085.1 hypothetical protein C7414_10825 [Cupriavidus alkaliphilus]
MAASAYYDQVQKVYVAYYGRPADPTGLEFWATKLDGVGGNLNAIIDAFGNSAESTALYGGQTHGEKINAIYQQMFGRDAEPAGLAFYTGLLAANPPKATLASIALDIVNGAQGSDKVAIEAKLAAAEGFTAALNTTAEILKYSGDWAAQQARDWLKPVDQAGEGSNPQAVIDKIVAGPAPQPGSKVLTTAIDTITLGAADTVTGGTETLTQGDSISGPGKVVLSLAAKQDLYSGTTIAGASKVTIQPTGDVAVTTKNWTDIQQVVVEKVKGDVSLEDLQGAATQYDLVDAIQAEDKITLNFDGQQIQGKEANVSVKEVNATVEINTDAGFDVETINLTINDDKAGFESNLTDLIGDGTKTLNIKGGQAGLDFGIKGALDSTLTTIDASGALANLSLNISESDQQVNVKLGSGNDVLNVGDSLRTGDVIDGGAGADKVVAVFDANATVAEANRAPTMSRVETLDATFLNAVHLDGTNINDLATINLKASSGRADFNNFDSTLKTLNIQGNLAQGVEVDYDGQALTTLDINIEGTTSVIGNAGNPSGIRVINADKVALSHNGSESVVISRGLQVDDSFSGRYTTDLSITNNSAGDLTIAGNNFTDSVILDGDTVQRLTIKSTGLGDLSLGSQFESLMDEATNLQHLVVEGATDSDIEIGRVGDARAAGDLETVKLSTGVSTEFTSWGIDAAGADKRATITSIDIAAGASGHMHLLGGFEGGEWLQAASVNLMKVDVAAGASVNGDASGTVWANGQGLGGLDIPAAYSNLVRLDLDEQAGADSKLILSGAGEVTGFAFEDNNFATIDASALKGSGVTIVMEDPSDAAAFTFIGSGQNDRVYASNSADNLSGGAGDDVIYANGGADIVNGGAGNDALYGGEGNDTVDGGAGDDFIAGGLHADVLTGGAGADSFYFNFDQNHLAEAGKSTNPGAAAKQDVITDFKVAEDTILVDVANPLAQGDYAMYVTNAPGGNGFPAFGYHIGEGLDPVNVVIRVGTYNEDGSFNYNANGTDLQLLFNTEGQAFNPLDFTVNNGAQAFVQAEHEVALLGAANQLGSLSTSDLVWI